MTDAVTDRIKAAFAQEQIDRPLATKATDIPVSFDAITDAWLTANLCAGIPDAEVTAHSLGPIDSGTSNRRRIFIEYNVAGRHANLPASVFCKASHDLLNRLLLSNGGAMSEATFYNVIRPRLGPIETPAALLATYDPEIFTSMIMLQDLGDSVTFCSHTTPMDRARVTSQLELLARLHGPFFARPELVTTFAGMLTFEGRFNGMVRRHNLRQACEDGLIAARDVVPPRLFARAAELWPATQIAADMHFVLPRTITHGDVHLKNWYVTADGRMGLGDWQVTCLGHWSRDVAYTIATALPPADRRVLERDLLAHYLQCLHAHGGPVIPFDDAWQDYRRQMLTALAWWTMTLSPTATMPDMQPRDTTLAFIHRLAVATDDLDALDA